MKTLAINLITRGRPDVLVRTINRTLPNISSPETIFMVSADEDDEATCDALRAFEDKVRVSIRPREDDIGSKYNRMLKYKADVYCNLSDYTAFVKPGFDRHILWAAEMFPDGIGMVVNPMRNASFTDIFALTKPLVDRLGFYFPTYFAFWFVDHWADDISKLIDRVILADCTDIEYDAQTGKSVTQNLRDLHFWTTFFDAAHLMRRRAAHAIVDALDEPEWRKAMIKSRAPLIEFRSKWINDVVRNNAQSLEHWANTKPPDERYLRVKARAMAMLKDELLPDLKAAA
jgi:hypothetical protein